MSILSRPSFAPRTALIYVTVGALIDVWTLVWYFTHESRSSITHFWVIGLFLTGLTFVVLGLLLGRLGQAARQAELPPQVALHAESDIQKTAAAASGGVSAPSQQPAPGVPQSSVPVASPTYVS